MAVTIDDIKKLKELTGIGLTDAKKALVEAEGDFDSALNALRKKGLTKAEKKGDRETREGLIESVCPQWPDRCGGRGQLRDRLCSSPA